MYRFKVTLLCCISLAALIIALLLPTGAARAVQPSVCGSWNTISSPNVGKHANYLNGVAAISSNDVWAVGNYSGSFDNVTKTLTEHWNGSQWNIVKSPSPSSTYNYLTSVAAISTNDVWAVGYDTANGPWEILTEHWNGNQWSIVKSTSPGPGNLVSVAAISSTDVWTAGAYFTGSTTSQWLVEHWNGQKWSTVPTPFPSGATSGGISSIAAISATNIWMIGGYATGNNSSVMVALHWNGSTWTVMPLPEVSTYVNTLFSVAAVSANDIWAVGDEYDNTNSYPRALVEHWNGSQWSVVQTPPTIYGIEALQGVVAISAKNVWAVGGYNAGNNTTAILIEHWDGHQWNIVSSPNGNGPGLFNATRVPGSSSMWAVGEVTNKSQVNRTLTAYYC